MCLLQVFQRSKRISIHNSKHHKNRVKTLHFRCLPHELFAPCKEKVPEKIQRNMPDNRSCSVLFMSALFKFFFFGKTIHQRLAYLYPVVSDRHSHIRSGCRRLNKHTCRVHSSSSPHCTWELSTNQLNVFCGTSLGLWARSDSFVHWLDIKLHSEGTEKCNNQKQPWYESDRDKVGSDKG